MTSLRILALGVLAALAITSLVAVSPAESRPRSWSPMVVSRDGKAWGETLQGPLFPRSTALVPGHHATRSFWVRNQSRDRGLLRIQVVTKDRQRWLGRGLRLSVRNGAGTGHSVVRPGRTPVVRVRIGPGDAGRIHVKAALAAGAGRSSMDRSLSFSLQLRMTQMKGARG